MGASMSCEPGLARLLAARLCHDLSGIVGSLAGTLDLVDPRDPTMLELARESALALRQRLRLHAAAWGQSATDLDAAGIEELLRGSPAAPRVGFAVRLGGSGEAGGKLPAGLVPLALNAALLGAEALPRGGTVHLDGDAERGFLVWPEGRSAAWSPTLLAALSGATSLAELLEDGPRRLLAPLLLALAAEAGWRLSLALAAGPAAAASCPPLSLAPA